MMCTGGRHFDGVPGVVLSDDVGEINPWLRLGAGRLDPTGQLRLARQPGMQLPQRSRTQYLDTVDEAGFAKVVDGDHDDRPTFPLRGQYRGQHTFARADPSIESQFAEQQGLFEP